MRSTGAFRALMTLIAVASVVFFTLYQLAQHL